MCLARVCQGHLKVVSWVFQECFRSVSKLFQACFKGVTSDSRVFQGVKEKSSSGKKFESPKKSNFFPLKLFSSIFFLVHMEAFISI